jgi:hypothetical protein
MFSSAARRCLVVTAGERAEASVAASDAAGCRTEREVAAWGGRARLGVGEGERHGGGMGCRRHGGQAGGGGVGLGEETGE